MKRPSEAFELGQFGLLLGCDFSLEDECIGVVTAHYACLKVLKPFILKATDILWRDGKQWKPIGAFPPPESDMVLHLALTSGNSFRPLKQPLYQMMEWPAMKNLLVFDTDRQRSGQVVRFEALVTASIVLASRSGGVHGAGLSSFLGVMLYELGVASEIEATQSSLDVEDALLSQVLVPFLSPPNAAWPDWFLSDWENTSAEFADLTFTADAKSGRLDFRVSSGATSFECSRSMNLSELDQVMDRIPSESSIHLIVTSAVDGVWETLKPAADSDRAAACTQFYHITNGSGGQPTWTPYPAMTTTSDSDAGGKKKTVLVLELAPGE
ncbi:hypothetical protein PHYSODRAFT_301251 [Phytophthora sojae]|uniref:Uncharacterized protein n=1 Tax=Phytophthora sojae (strain P6497) TaxID=1094619 RepID=G4ZHN7_PHYSP|nr:hypothetical protein PHYSODRAFT_301251 [Phytophthora sojae]EGZ18692.1 hypothetical protein PHYSODRAFT_301251 [Phytophthora sojae]|eukprot:XP_009527750.1 hypothetical protein PHYSODRAFT_301251 [Phytophthora sojae]